MLLFVGLGNPTPNRENNRHNIGFKIIDAINKKFSLSKQKPKFKGLLTTGEINGEKVYAIKPLTFMNNSGTAIKELIDYFKIDAKDVFVFHDDMDIDFGKILTDRLNQRELNDSTPPSSRISSREIQASTYYRVPLSPSVDNNTVEIGVEQAKFGQATSDYQASLQFFEGKVSSLFKAIRGE